MFCATEGYFDKEDRENRRTRLIAHQTHWANVDKQHYKQPEEFWPIFGDEENKVEGGAFSETPQEMIDAIFKANGIKSVPKAVKPKENV